MGSKKVHNFRERDIPHFLERDILEGLGVSSCILMLTVLSNVSTATIGSLWISSKGAQSEAVNWGSRRDDI
jgi:hypothetical protein